MISEGYAEKLRLWKTDLIDSVGQDLYNAIRNAFAVYKRVTAARTIAPHTFFR
jgi:hypothetical protein